MDAQASLLGNNSRSLEKHRPSARAKVGKQEGAVQVIDAEDPATEPPGPPSEDIDWSAVALPFVFPAIGGALFGYDIGATSGAVVSLKDAALSGTSWFDLSPLATGLVVSGSLGGALLGSILAYLIADPIGRRKELLSAAALYLVGALLMAFAPTLPMLVAGRVAYGLGIGLAMHGAPMYIAETAPSKVRGTLISLKEAFIVGGILLGYLGGYFEIGEVGGWRWMYGLSAPAAVVMAAGMLWLPESPRWLLLRASENKGDPSALKGEARSCLNRLLGARASDEQADEKVSDILDALNADKGEEDPGADAWKELLTGPNIKALTIGTGLVFFQQVTGQPSVLYYAATIFKDAGFAEASEATKISVFLGTLKLAATMLSVVVVDKAGRRPLLLAGVSGICASLLALAAYYSSGQSAPIASVVALLVYVGCYQISFGPISWLMVSEIFPLRVRGRALSLATLVNFGSNALVSFALPTVQEDLGQAGTFFTFFVIALVSLVFIYFQVPETKGLSLEEIEEQLGKS